MAVIILFIRLYDRGYYTFQYSLKNLDPSYKMDLDFSDCFETEKDGSRLLIVLKGINSTDN